MITSPLTDSRNPRLAPDQRLAEAVSAMFGASSLNDMNALQAAFRSVNAVRHSTEVNTFDVRRADLIYFSCVGDREKALTCAYELAAESRIVRDVELACRGLRNASTTLAHFGQYADAQRVLHEARSLSSKLEYHAQTAAGDVNLAELCLQAMDLAGTVAYLDSAAEAMQHHKIFTAPLLVDLNYIRCWERLIAGDTQSAQRAARIVVKQLQRAREGIMLWTALSVKLATHGGAHTKQSNKEYAILRASVGSKPFYPFEQFNLCALLIYKRGTAHYKTETAFVAAQLERLCANGRPVWPLLGSLVTSS